MCDPTSGHCLGRVVSFETTKGEPGSRLSTHHLSHSSTLTSITKYLPEETKKTVSTTPILVPLSYLALRLCCCRWRPERLHLTSAAREDINHGQGTL